MRLTLFHHQLLTNQQTWRNSLKQQTPPWPTIYITSNTDLPYIIQVHLPTTPSTMKSNKSHGSMVPPKQHPTNQWLHSHESDSI